MAEMKHTDGGPAFPVPNDANVNDQGMTLRDYFAGQALTGMMMGHAPGRGSTEWQAHAAWDAYSVSDAMLLERSKATSHNRKDGRE